MAKQIPGRLYSFPAAADHTANQFKFMVVDSAGRIGLAGAGVAVDGVLQDKPNAVDRHGSLMIDGISKVFAGAVAIARGANVSSDATGRAITSATTDYIVGRALAASAAAGEIIPVLITRPGRLA